MEYIIARAAEIIGTLSLKRRRRKSSLESRLLISHLRHFN